MNTISKMIVKLPTMCTILAVTFNLIGGVDRQTDGKQTHCNWGKYYDAAVKSCDFCHCENAWDIDKQCEKFCRGQTTTTAVPSLKPGKNGECDWGKYYDDAVKSCEFCRCKIDWDIADKCVDFCRRTTTTSAIPSLKPDLPVKTHEMDNTVFAATLTACVLAPFVVIGFTLYIVERCRARKVQACHGNPDNQCNKRGTNETVPPDLSAVDARLLPRGPVTHPQDEDNASGLLESTV